MKKLLILFLSFYIIPIIQTFALIPNEGNVPDLEEYDALVELYNTTAGPNWIRNNNWTNGQSNADFATWDGVVVANGDVIGLELEGNNLDGALPDQLIRLTELKTINLSGNNLYGNLPEWINTFKYLETLNLAVNNFTGRIPDQLGELADLQILNLSNNQFDGEIPGSLSQLTHLTQLFLANNNLTGQILPIFDQLISLQYLGLNNNYFEGEIPKDLGNLTQLEVLNLSNNNLRGRIPETLFKLQSLKQLIISNNKLTGVLSGSVSHLAALEILDLSENHLSGIIPSGIGGLTNLTQLILSKNAFTGDVPIALQQLTHLNFIAIDYNQLSSLPYLNNLPNKSSVIFRLGDNKIDLYDLDPYFTNVSTTQFSSFSYSQQNPIIRTEVVTFLPGSPARLNGDQGNSKFNFQWQRFVNNSWVDLSGQASYFYQINATVASDEGLYRCMISHDWANQVTHSSKEFYLKIKQTSTIGQAANDPPTSADIEPSWVMETTFDENGNEISKTKEFSDGFGKTIQSQTKNFTHEHILATQTLYDTRGRAAITTLPAPINNQVFNFKEDFILDQSGKNYSADNFEGAAENNPDPLNSSPIGSLGWYYSANNTYELDIAQSQYPFSRTTFYEGPLGGIKSISQPGNELKTGSGKEIRTREMPILNEMDHYMALRDLFVPNSSGSNATLHSKGIKTISIDPLGKEVITFKDGNGNTIATCISEYQTNPLYATFSISSDNTPDKPKYIDFHITSPNSSTIPVTVTGLFYGKVKYVNIVTLEAGEITLGASQQNILNLAPGFYRILSISTGFLSSQSITYPLHYGQYSYSFYDDAGRLVATVDTKGINRTSTAYPNFAKLFKHSATSDFLQTTSPDEGTTEYIYRKDGKLRFSQSAQQKTKNVFSFINYDKAGRVIETGEHSTILNAPSSQTTIFESQYSTVNPVSNSVLDPTLLENTDLGGGLVQANSSQISSTWYDLQFGDNELGVRTQRFTLGRISKTQNDNATTWFSYDALGRIEWIITKTGLGVKTFDYSYDLNGNLLQAAYQKDVAGEMFIHKYTYDPDKRLSKVETSSDNTTWKKQAEYTYYLHGPLKRVVLGNSLQGIDYSYTIQGWLKSINNADPTQDPGNDGQSNGVRPDLFGQTLEYFSGDYTAKNYVGNNVAAGGNRFDGLVSASFWHTLGQRPQGYAYFYDKKNQLEQGAFGSLTGGLANKQFTLDPSYAFLETPQYDANGNLSLMQRKDKFGTLATDYTYNYQSNTNKLNNITQNYNQVLSYGYDADGKTTVEHNPNGSQYFTYDTYGLVTEIHRDANKTKLLLKIDYDDRGKRLRKRNYDENGNLLLTTWYANDANGNNISTYEEKPGGALKRIEVPVYGTTRIGMWRRNPDNTSSYNYELTDHLGSTRLVFREPATTSQTATMEPVPIGGGNEGSRMSQEEDEFEHVSETRHLDLARARTGRYAALLNIARGKREGPAKNITVKQGDSISVEAFGYYEPIKKRKHWLPLSLAPALSFLGVKQGQEIGSNSGKSLSPVVGAGIAIAPSALLKRKKEIPIAYLQLQVFDADSNLVDTKKQLLSPAATLGYERLNIEYEAEQDGYVRVALINESTVDTWFDDMRISFTGIEVVEENHLYPYGQQMEELSYVTGGALAYRHGFQGIYAERDKETGLSNFDLRMYNGSIGRWLAPDPYRQYASPYIGMGNNPVNGVDPDGGFLSPFSLSGALIGAGIGAVAGYTYASLTDKEDPWKYALGGAIVGAAIGGFGFSDYSKAKILNTHTVRHHYTNFPDVITPKQLTVSTTAFRQVSDFNAVPGRGLSFGGSNFNSFIASVPALRGWKTASSGDGGNFSVQGSNQNFASAVSHDILNFYNKRFIQNDNILTIKVSANPVEMNAAFNQWNRDGLGGQYSVNTWNSLPVRLNYQIARSRLKSWNKEMRRMGWDTKTVKP